MSTPRPLLPLLALLAACATTPATMTPTATPTPEPWAASWDRGLPDTAALSHPRGFRQARSIVHLHSTHSHDACDGEPQPGGAHDLECGADLVEGLCETRQDVAFLSDHPGHFAQAEWGAASLLLAQGGAALDEAGAPADPSVATARVLDCDNGHQVLWFPGVEDELMPLGLQRHVGPAGIDAAERDRLYNRYSAEAVADLQDAGATVFVAHTEGRERADLAALGLDGIEIYNLHANIGPDIREEHLGLEPFGFLDAAGVFMQDAEEGLLEPDLLFLSFFLPNQPALDHWDALLPSQALIGTAGTDAHRNTLPIPLSDGERVDSYRRMLRWFGNWLLIEPGPDQATPAAARAALAAGRLFVVFEALGTPLGFDFALVDETGQAVAEMGDSAPWQEGLRVRLTLPTVLDGPPTAHPQAPAIEAVLYAIESSGRRELARGSGPTLEVALDAPTIVRAEVHITPHHLAPLLPGSERLIQPMTWIYSNPIRIETSAR